MGGNIAWTIRKDDGTEFRMSRWTNIFPGVITDDFLEGKPEAFDEAMRAWFDMKADWEKNGPDGPFKENMTSVYAPYPYGLKPDEYGFIVTDFLNKTLISCNRYTSFDHIWAMKYWWHDEEEKEHYSDRIARYQKMFVEGRILNLWKFTNLSHQKIDLPAASDFKDLVVQCCEIVGDSVVNFDIAPHQEWKFEEYLVDSKADRKKAFESVKELGFVLTADEIAGWNEWVKG